MTQSEDWRERLQELLARHFPAGKKTGGTAARDRVESARTWHAELVDHNLAAPGWPTTAGGLGLTVEDQLDYYRMITAAGAPPHPCPLSFILAPTLITHGTDAQKDQFLRPLLRADEFWCQGSQSPAREATWPRCRRERFVTAMSTSCRARRSGRRWPTGPIGCSR